MTRVKIVCGCKVFDISKEIAERSIVLKDMFEDIGDSLEPIPLPIINPIIFEKIIHFWNLTNYETFFEENFESLYDLIKIANYLDIENLLKLGISALIDKITGKSPIEIKTLLKLDIIKSNWSECLYDIMRMIADSITSGETMINWLIAYEDFACISDLKCILDLYRSMKLSFREIWPILEIDYNYYHSLESHCWYCNNSWNGTINLSDIPNCDYDKFMAYLSKNYAIIMRASHLYKEIHISSRGNDDYCASAVITLFNQFIKTYKKYNLHNFEHCTSILHIHNINSLHIESFEYDPETNGRNYKLLADILPRSIIDTLTIIHSYFYYRGAGDEVDNDALLKTHNELTPIFNILKKTKIKTLYLSGIYFKWGDLFDGLKDSNIDSLIINGTNEYDDDDDYMRIYMDKYYNNIDELVMDIAAVIPYKKFNFEINEIKYSIINQQVTKIS